MSEYNCRVSKVIPKSKIISRGKEYNDRRTLKCIGSVGLNYGMSLRYERFWTGSAWTDWQLYLIDYNTRPIIPDGDLEQTAATLFVRHFKPS